MLGVVVMKPGVCIPACAVSVLLAVVAVLPGFAITIVDDELAAYDLKIGGLTKEESRFLKDIDIDNAWTHLEYLAGLGEKVAGTAEELTAQQYARDCMVDAGLDEVVMETFATSSWDHHGTTLTITSPVQEDMPATTYGGCYSVWGMQDYQYYYFGNENNGMTLTGPVVDVGTATAVELNAAGNLEGAIALVHRDDTVIPWPSITVEEVALHGASAVLFYGYFDWYPDPEAIKQDAVGGPLPAFSISYQSAERIKDLMESSQVTAQIDGSADLYSIDYAQSVNVVGYLYGTTYPDQYIVFSAHADTWWAGANDDCSGVAGVLELARHFSEARSKGSFSNERTLVFCTFGSEEYGGPSSWYNWIVGSYEFISAHPEIVEGLVINLNLDMIGNVRTHGPYWLENTWEINDFLKQTLADSKVEATWCYPILPYTDAWSFASVGGGSAVYASYVEGEYAYYHTQLDNMSLSSPDSMRDMLCLFGLMALRLDDVLVMPFDFMTTITWIDSFLRFEAASVPSEAELFDQVDTALSELRSEVMAINAYRHELEAAYSNANTNEEREAILEDIETLNHALIEARRIVNPWSIGQGGPTGTDEVFLRPEQHVHDIIAIADAISDLANGSLEGAMNALEGVHAMEWAPLCSLETYNVVIERMYSDQADQMYWAGEFGQQQEYVLVYAIYSGLANGTISLSEAQLMLESIRDCHLIPWLQEDLLTLEWAWTEATGVLSAVHA